MAKTVHRLTNYLCEKLKSQFSAYHPNSIIFTTNFITIITIISIISSHPFTHSFIHPFIHSPIHSPIHSFIHPSIHPINQPTNQPTNQLPLTKQTMERRSRPRLNSEGEHFDVEDYFLRPEVQCTDCPQTHIQRAEQTFHCLVCHKSIKGSNDLRFIFLSKTKNFDILFIYV